MDHAGEGGASGPLRGFRVIELSGVLARRLTLTMLLSDLGADVIRVDRPEAVAEADGGQARTILWPEAGGQSASI